MESIKLDRVQTVEAEITTKIPLEVSRRVQEIRFLTESGCRVAYGDDINDGRARTYDAEKTVRNVYDEHLDLWQERYALLNALEDAKEDGHADKIAQIEEETGEIERKIKENDRKRRR